MQELIDLDNEEEVVDKAPSESSYDSEKAKSVRSVLSFTQLRLQNKIKNKFRQSDKAEPAKTQRKSVEPLVLEGKPFENVPVAHTNPT